MFISKKKKGYGWYSKVTSKDMGGNELTSYLEFNFKKECEPMNLNEYGSLEGDLYFIANDGTRRKVYPRVKFYNNQTHVEFMLLEELPPIEQKGYENTNMNGMGNYEDDTEMEELPFY